jgi:hypothetical protein
VAYTYTTFTQAISTFTSIPLTNAALIAAMPNIIDQAEQRIYTAFDLLATVVRDSSASTTGGTRNFTLPQPGSSRYEVVQSINIVNGATRTPVLKVSRELMDVLWPSDVGNGSIPNRWAPVTDQTILFGPAPTTEYDVEIYGTIRPAPLSATNSETFLSRDMSALFFAAAMIAASGYMKNFGSQADDPKMSASWQSQYDALLPSYKAEEMARKFAGFYGGS